MGQPGRALGNTAGPFKVRFDDGVSSGSGTIASVSLADGSGFSFALPGAQASASSREGGSGLGYAGVQPGVSLHYAVIPTGVKESIELANANAPATFTFVLTPNAGSRFAAVQAADGSWIFTAPGGTTPLFVLQAPTVGDAGTLIRTGGELVPVATGSQQPASLDVRATGDGSFLATLSIDPQWLQDPARLFPVLIDPTVTLSPDSRDAVFDTSCGTCTPAVGTTMNVAGGVAGAAYQDSVLQFDLSGIVPTGISSATLALWWSSCAPLACGTASGNGQQGDIGLYQLSTAWNQSTTTADLRYFSTQLSHVPLTVWSGGDQPNKWVLYVSRLGVGQLAQRHVREQRIPPATGGRHVAVRLPRGRLRRRHAFTAADDHVEQRRVRALPAADRPLERRRV